MKILPVALLSSLLGVASGFAGSFGPPPFSNGSPLQTGTDGTYQAAMSGTNMSGILRFAYSGGVQSGSTVLNNWIAFVDGQIIRGTPETTIGGDGSIFGVLDSNSASGGGSSEDGNIVLPLIFIVGGANSSGDFKAKLDFKSPFGTFTGTGAVAGAAGTTETIYIISTNAIGNVTSTNVSYTNTGGTLSNTPFKLWGMRTSTSATGGSTNSSSTNSQ